jgi:hypothetical protein
VQVSSDIRRPAADGCQNFLTTGMLEETFQHPEKSPDVPAPRGRDLSNREAGTRKERSQAVDGTETHGSKYKMEEVPRSVELKSLVKDALNRSVFEAGQWLKELFETIKDYGEWKTFDNFVHGEFGITPKTAGRLMFAYDMKELFKANGRLLPISERSVRPLTQLDVAKQRTKKKLTLEELQLKAWDLAITVKQRSTPTWIDVMRAVRQLMTPTPDESTDKAFRIYRRDANRVRLVTAKMVKQMPGLVWFLECTDPKTRRQKKEMGKMLADLTTSLDGQRFTFQGGWEPNRKLFEEGDYLAALAKAKRLESETEKLEFKAARLKRMVIIWRVRASRLNRRGTVTFKSTLEPEPLPPVQPLPDTAYRDSLDMWINRNQKSD